MIDFYLFLVSCFSFNSENSIEITSSKKENPSFEKEIQTSCSFHPEVLVTTSPHPKTRTSSVK